VSHALKERGGEESGRRRRPFLTRFLLALSLSSRFAEPTEDGTPSWCRLSLRRSTCSDSCSSFLSSSSTTSSSPSLTWSVPSLSLSLSRSPTTPLSRSLTFLLVPRLVPQPMKAMVYKTLSTVVDDFFSFVIKMPWFVFSHIPFSPDSSLTWLSPFLLQASSTSMLQGRCRLPRTHLPEVDLQGRQVES